MSLEAKHSDSADTLLAHAGRPPAMQNGAVNPPVYHASTVLFPTVAALEESVRKRNEPGHFHYGRFGTPPPGPSSRRWPPSRAATMPWCCPPGLQPSPPPCSPIAGPATTF
jgi:hypothetical protein